MQQQTISPEKATGAILLLIALSACGSGGSDTPAPPPAMPDTRAQAATATVQQNSNCQAIAPFYWEIGDATGILAAGTAGDGSVTRTTAHSIGSATKWLFGAYVAQKRNGALTTDDVRALTMLSGYTNFGVLSCSALGASATVENCFNLGSNDGYTAAHDGKFFYNGGHFQKWAVDNGMGAMTSAALANEFQAVLGADAALSFSTPQLAGGAYASAESYARFLTRVLKQELRIAALLGANAVCTLPSACADAISSPIREQFSYSLGHWVESDPTTGDGSFSSAGIFGFYPWIDASKTYYGIVSRHEVPTANDEIGAGWASVRCGRLIRKAYLSGQAQ